MDAIFPDIVTSLPLADIPLGGLDARLLQAGEKQVLFMEFNEDAEVPEHRHEAQWGAVLDGEIELTIGNEMHVLTKGETYFIPKNAPHSARIKKGYKDITLFNQKDRYKAKE